ARDHHQNRRMAPPGREGCRLGSIVGHAAVLHGSCIVKLRQARNAPRRSAWRARFSADLSRARPVLAPRSRRCITDARRRPFTRSAAGDWSQKGDTHTMTVQLDHTIVPSRDRKAAAELLARILAVPWAESGVGPFCPVYVNDGLTLDMDQAEDGFPIQH